MTSGRYARLLDAFERRGGILARRDIASLGFGSDDIRRLLATGAIVRAAHGIYRLADTLPFGTAAFAQACLAIPSGVIALETALSYYGFTTQISDAVQIAVPRAVVRTRMEIPLQIMTMPADRFASGVERIRTAEGDRFRAFSRERTVCDCFAYHRLVAESVAYEGLRTYLASENADPTALLHEAEVTATLPVVAPVVKTLQE